MTRSNLTGQHFRIGFNEGVPFLRIDGWNETDHTYKNLDGIDSWILRILKEYYNFTFELRNCHGQFGMKIENGTWTGIIGKLVRNEIDFGIGSIIISEERSKSVGFLQPYWITHYTFATTKTTYETDLFTFLRPFQMNVWYCLFILLLITWLIDQISNHFLSANSNLIVITLLLLIQRPYRNHHLNSSDKLWIFIFAISSLILVHNYSGNLGSMLTVREMIEINSIDQLVKACQLGRIIPLVLRNSIGMKYLQQIFTSEKRLDPIRNTFQEIKNLNDGINLIAYGSVTSEKRFALLGVRERLLFGHLRYGYYLPPENEETFFFSSHFSMATRLTFEYRKQFNVM
ncbi:hypothetical protein BLA29_006696 [Euroglyphus maynei]|uniref:Ionotropic glutamate receptor L-glutamate and glycine-binding domain-containing protein n=1 Tax=Euroglyphus maynei TaxID=6958 RepID=A0A1Y3B3Z5_EURMA|nr:hypothetical protein BLA29_006696 [Euroglyphus maynei]